jgi:predicted GIY-YIG superfamily endonuclease
MKFAGYESSGRRSGCRAKATPSRGKASCGASKPKKAYTSSKSTGCYTTSGTVVRNPSAYAATGAPILTKYGDRVWDAQSYSFEVQKNSAVATAKAAQKANPKAKAFTYTMHLEGGKRYVGYSGNPEQRVKQHFAGNGAKVTQECTPLGVSFTPHYSVAAAKRAETDTYYEQKDKLGVAKVRGAGNTARFSKSLEPQRKYRYSNSYSSSSSSSSCSSCSTDNEDFEY